MPHDARALARAARARARERGEPYTAARQAVLAIRQRMAEFGETYAEAETNLGAPVLDEAGLNPKHIFDTFVIGFGNRFAHAVAVTAAEAPGKAHNPLFIYGGSGLSRRRYQDADVLLLDDIQFLGNETGIQEEFFRAFIAMLNTGRQIVITSDRAPRRLVSAEDRLRVQLERGLLTDIQSQPAGNPAASSRAG